MATKTWLEGSDCHAVDQRLRQGTVSTKTGIYIKPLLILLSITASAKLVLEDCCFESLLGPSTMLQTWDDLQRSVSYR